MLVMKDLPLDVKLQFRARAASHIVETEKELGLDQEQKSDVVE